VIEINATLDKAGILQSCDVRGHADAGPKGTDIVCAAVSVLARTAWEVLSGREGVRVRYDAPQRGVFSLEIEADEAEKPFLSGVSAFLLAGFGSVAQEHPECCSMSVLQK
jgi:uncharacterized protein YsxB (DUF464 family)